MLAVHINLIMEWCKKYDSMILVDINFPFVHRMK